jgi:hypothetical protein
MHCRLSGLAVLGLKIESSMAGDAEAPVIKGITVAAGHICPFVPSSRISKPALFTRHGRTTKRIYPKMERLIISAISLPCCVRRSALIAFRSNTAFDSVPLEAVMNDLDAHLKDCGYFPLRMARLIACNGSGVIKLGPVRL